MKANQVALFVAFFIFISCETTAVIAFMGEPTQLLESIRIDNCTERPFKNLPRKVIRGFNRRFGVNLKEIEVTDEDIVSSDLLFPYSLNKKAILSCDCEPNLKFVLYEKRSAGRTQDLAIWKRSFNKGYELKLLTMRERHFSLESLIAAIQANHFWEADAF